MIEAITAGLSATKAGIDLVKTAKDITDRAEIDSIF